MSKILEATLNQLINQSINQSIDQSIHQSIILFSDAGYKSGGRETDLNLQLTKMRNKCEMRNKIICKITPRYGI